MRGYHDPLGAMSHRVTRARGESQGGPHRAGTEGYDPGARAAEPDASSRAWLLVTRLENGEHVGHGGLLHEADAAAHR
jgi:hypothetical protein